MRRRIRIDSYDRSQGQRVLLIAFINYLPRNGAVLRQKFHVCCILIRKRIKINCYVHLADQLREFERDYVNAVLNLYS